MDEELYREYLLEKFGEPERRDDGIERATEVASSARLPEGNPLDGLLRVSDLPKDHPAVELVERRGILRPFWARLYHSDDYYGWAARLAPEKYGHITRKEPRLVIPIQGDGGRLVGFRGRAYDPDVVRYLTVALDKTVPFLYGWDRVDTTRTIVAVEGPIDSLFLANAVASAGGSIQREIWKAPKPEGNVVIAYDNEPRSPATVKKMLQAVEDGFSIFVWPEDVREKDFNDWFLALRDRGMDEYQSIQLMMETINSRTFQDLEAELEVQAWSRCRL